MLEQLWLCPYGPVTRILGLKSGEVISGVCPHSRSKEKRVSMETLVVKDIQSQPCNMTLERIIRLMP
eukprot:scaffold80420_cov49-Cyclotella_meneghiniana.AAC.1